MGLTNLKKLLTSHKFVLSVGDLGAVLTHFENGKLKKRLFSPTSNAEETEQFTKLLHKHPNANIAILVDIMDQTYTQQKLPGVSSLSIQKLAEKRLKRDLENADLSGALPVSREKSGRKQWNYLFISLAIAPPLSDWLEYIANTPNPCRGIFLTPVETTQMFLKLHQKTKTYKERRNQWKLCAIHNKVGGIRQVVIKGKSLIFTRITNTTNETKEEIIAGNIEQEILNTTEYIKRLNETDEIELAIYIITEDEIKRHIDKSKLPAKTPHLLTPFELAKTVGLKQSAEPNDKFGDTLIAAHFIKKSRPTLTLHTNETKKLNTLYTIKKAANIVITASLAILISYGSYIGLSLHNIAEEIQFTKQQQQQTINSWSEEAKNFGEYDIDTATKINNTSKLHQNLVANKFSPNTIISKFRGVLPEYMRVKHLSWNIEQTQADAFNNQFSNSNLLLNIEIDYLTENKSIQELFEQFDNFIYQLESTFRKSNIEFSELPSTFKLGEERKSIPIKINIVNKLNKKAEQ